MQFHFIFDRLILRLPPIPPFLSSFHLSRHYYFVTHYDDLLFYHFHYIFILITARLQLRCHTVNAKILLFDESISHQYFHYVSHVCHWLQAYCFITAPRVHGYFIEISPLIRVDGDWLPAQYLTGLYISALASYDNASYLSIPHEIACISFISCSRRPLSYVAQGKIVVNAMKFFVLLHFHRRK